ncbi:MAG: NAD-dependent epimerase/dehydratase family protein [Polyangiaceae bacterium]|nr:NAD-dependent epimerase/dehydratase family protein [Polyangiaceae bacterium]
MRVLVLGGTRFMGHFLVYRLLAAGHRVTLLNRGKTPDAFGDRVGRVRADRRTADLAEALAGREFDAAVDFTAYGEADARGAIRALAGRVGHYVMISTGQVYLVREDCPRPAREPDYDGPVMPEPADPDDKASWDYGIGKRACEDALAEAWDAQRFPSTRLRIPMVNGPRDPDRRIERYIARMLDGGPVIVPDGGTQRVRHAFAVDVADAILKVLVSPHSIGQAYNFCHREAPTLAGLLSMIAEALGAFPRFVPVPSSEIVAAGLDLRALSPFSSRWMSLLDPGRAEGELGIHHRPLDRCIEEAVTCLLAHPAAEPPPGYARRPDELALAARFAGGGEP